MGLFRKSVLVLLIALSTPLIYRHFANDNTIRFMSTYYSNYKSIDQFLRQSAGHIERAREYLPSSDQLKSVVDNINTQVKTLIESAKDQAKSQSAGVKSGDSQVDDGPKLSKCPTEGSVFKLWNQQELSKFDGNSDQPNIYLAFLGLVYDVTINSQHYARGAEYNAFAGRDATRAFVTGNFTHDLHDYIEDIEESLYSHIESWASFYNTSYPILGRIEGRFYDSQGCPTAELFRVKQVFVKLEQAKEKQKDQDIVLPECNSEWNGDLKQGKVWCSTKSGGIERDWAGLPRVYSNGDVNRCACYNPDLESARGYAAHLSLYPNCDPKATECLLNQANV